MKSPLANLVLGYCPEGNGHTIAPFDRVFGKQQDISKSIQGVDAVVFWGGTDIHPSLYGEEAHPKSQAYGSTPSKRDLFEWNAMKYCKTNNIPMIGVCRGAQLMCAFAGGTLIQHVHGHVGGRGNHAVNTKGHEKFFDVTSCHHQMMYPFNVHHDMLAWSAAKMSDRYESADGYIDMAGKVEPEIVFFPDINGLAIQGHPEWAVTSAFADYCNEMILSLFVPVLEI